VASNPSITGIFISINTYAYDSDRAKALDVGCDDYIAKPLTGDVLKKKLRKHLLPFHL